MTDAGCQMAGGPLPAFHLDGLSKCWQSWDRSGQLSSVVEQLICNQQVVGSSPTAGSTYFSLYLQGFYDYMASYAVCEIISPLPLCCHFSSSRPCASDCQFPDGRPRIPTRRARKMISNSFVAWICCLPSTWPFHPAPAMLGPKSDVTELREGIHTFRV